MIINNKRALAHIQLVHNIQDIPGADNIQLAYVLGWSMIIKKGEFKENDKCVFFEIDSRLPSDDERFSFLEKKGYKVKTFKLSKFGVIGQGLALPLSDFPELGDLDVNTDVTDKLKVKYSVEEDNVRKAYTEQDKVARLYSKHKKFMKSRFGKWCIRHKFTRNLVFKFLAKKKDDKGFPSKFCSKTDEERIQNMPLILNDKEEKWTVTEKIDGTSTTFVLVRKGILGRRFEFIVSSRNVRQYKEDQECMASGKDFNCYWYVAKKYKVEEALKDLLKKHKGWKYVVLQGETYGKNLQGNPLKQEEVKFAGFNLKMSREQRFGSVEAKEIMSEYNIPWVPIITEDFTLLDSVQEMLEFATGKSSINNEVLREGYVFRSKDGSKSFKAVSPEYLMKHNL